MDLKAGWLDRQFERLDDDIEKWPEWMKREAAFGTPATDSTSESVDTPPLTRSAASECSD